MLDCQGYLVEGTMSNLFWVKDDTVYTPAIAQAGVNGIVRQWLMTYMQETGQSVVIDRFLPEQLLEAEQVFLSNAVLGVWPVRQLHERLFKPGELTRQLQAAYQAARVGAL